MFAERSAWTGDEQDIAVVHSEGDYRGGRCQPSAVCRSGVARGLSLGFGGPIRPGLGYYSLPALLRSNSGLTSTIDTLYLWAV